MNANRAMRNIIAQRQSTAASAAIATTMPNELAHILASGVEVRDGCVIAREPSTPSFRAVRESVMDCTGYECFVNHAHFVQRTPTTGLSQAEEFCRRVTPLLQQVSSVTDFRFIISNDGDEWTVTFHAIRPGETWVSEDLEGYAEEAVMVVDAAELSTLG